MRSSLTEINGSWPVLVGLFDSFGVRNISTGTLGASPPIDLRVVCLVRALAVPQNKLTSGVGERDLNIATGHLGDVCGSATSTGTNLTLGLSTQCLVVTSLQAYLTVALDSMGNWQLATGATTAAV